MNDDFFKNANIIAVIAMTILGIVLLLSAAFRGSLWSAIFAVSALVYPFNYITNEEGESDE